MEIVHSMSDTATDCRQCNAVNSLEKQLTIPRIKSHSTSKKSKNVGSVVKNTIKEYKERVSAEKGIWEDFNLDSVLGGDKK